MCNLYLRSIATPLPDGLRDALLGPLHQLHLVVQHGHEALFPRLIRRHRLPDVRQVQGHLRSQPRHVQDRVPRGSRGGFGAPPQSRVQRYGGALDVLHLSGVGGHSAAALHGVQDGRGRDDHIALSLRARILQGFVHPELDLPLLLRGLLRHHRHRSRLRPDDPLLRFLLPLRHQGPQGKENSTSGLIIRKDEEAKVIEEKEKNPPQVTTSTVFYCVHNLCY